MKIAFKNNRLEKSLTVASQTKKQYGHLAKRIVQRMESLYAAHNLAVIQSLPALECHPLHGDREGEWAISISGNHRIVFVIDQQPVPKKNDDSIALDLITRIRILEIIDYH